MTLQTSGRISIGNIRDEFDPGGSGKLSDFYAAAQGIPVSGRLKLSDFYGKRRSIGSPITKLYSHFATPNGWNVYPGIRNIIAWASGDRMVLSGVTHSRGADGKWTILPGTIANTTGFSAISGDGAHWYNGYGEYRTWNGSSWTLAANGATVPNKFTYYGSLTSRDYEPRGFLFTNADSTRILSCHGQVWTRSGTSFVWRQRVSAAYRPVSIKSYANFGSTLADRDCTVLVHRLMPDAVDHTVRYYNYTTHIWSNIQTIAGTYGIPTAMSGDGKTLVVLVTSDPAHSATNQVYDILRRSSLTSPFVYSSRMVVTVPTNQEIGAKGYYDVDALGNPVFFGENVAITDDGTMIYVPVTKALNDGPIDELMQLARSWRTYIESGGQWALDTQTPFVASCWIGWWAVDEWMQIGDFKTAKTKYVGITARYDEGDEVSDLVFGVPDDGLLVL